MGRNDQEHFERLELVLQRLEEYGLRVNKRKSEFFKKSVNYCGHTIDKFGLHKTQEKIDAITKIDKEALSIVWGVKRFYQYLFGRHFDLVTDHKPLVSIFAPNRGLPCLSATRMVHYALFLQAFSYTIKYRNTKNHGNADVLSRLPLAVDKDYEYFTEADVTNISQVELMPVTATDIARATKTDRKLFELYESLKSGIELPVP
ncbi:transposon Tf2-9 polyprotein [Trichonephila clavipes]|nr:transposon Tf2-9 polyprotein [Trichonephila clavipes]